MRVEFGLFDGDTLLERGELLVSQLAQCDHFNLFHAAHRLDGDSAQIVLSSFPDSFKLKTASLDMPIHQSIDWESIDLAGHTLAFKCSLDA